MQNGQFGSKFKNAKKVRKTVLRPHWSGCVQETASTLEWLCAKNRFKKGLICEKQEHFENGQNWPKAWVIAHAKWSVWVKN